MMMDGQTMCLGMTGLDWALMLLLIPLMILTRRYLIALVWVKGDSMLPAFRHGDLVLVNRLRGRWGRIPAGRVVLCHYPGRYLDKKHRFRTLFIKRLMALPGDTIAMEAGQVVRNGVLLPEPYLDPARCSPCAAFPEKTMGADDFFVMGDNRRSSNDSRWVGPLPRRMINGVVVCRVASLGGRGR